MVFILLTSLHACVVAAYVRACRAAAPPRCGMASQLGSLTALVVIPACAVLESALRHSHRSIRAQRLGVAADGQNCY